MDAKGRECFRQGVYPACIPRRGGTCPSNCSDQPVHPLRLVDAQAILVLKYLDYDPCFQGVTISVKGFWNNKQNIKHSNICKIANKASGIAGQ